MKQTISNKIILISSVLLLNVHMIAFAAVPNDLTNIDEPIVQADCLGGKEQFGTFLKSFIGFMDFDAVFKDLKMNGCQFTAVKTLKDKLEDMREEIKDAFYTCNSEKASELRLEYNRKEAELYYVRNIVDTKKSKRIPAELNTLKEKMKKIFVNKRGYFKIDATDPDDKREVWDVVFAEFQRSHSAEDFLECSEDIAAITDAITNIKTSIENIVNAFKDGADDIKEEADNIAGTGNKSASKVELKLSAQEIFAKTINGVSPLKGIQEIGRTFDLHSLSVLELNQHVEDEKVRYELDMQKAKALARYKAKYQHTSDAISKDYSTRAQLLIQSLNRASDNLKQANDCLSETLERQCAESA